MMHARKEMIVGCGALSGVLLVVVGIGVGLLFGTAGGFVLTKTRNQAEPDVTLLVLAQIGPLLMGLGGLVTLASIVYGLWFLRSRDTTKSVVARPESVILARYAVDRDGTMSFDPEPPEDPSFRLYLRVQFVDGSSDEFRVPEEVYRSAGEGQKGTVFVQGGWIGRFERNKE